MSLRFKALRSSSNYNKTQFADLMQVAYRTVTNWEKKDGVIPSLSTISSIAKALHVPTYTVYDCFMNNPDSDPEENFFEFNKHDLTDGYRKSSLPGLLFKVMNTLHLFGGGILQYEGHVFYYSHISYKERKNTATNLDEELDYFMFPYEGIILHDDNLNLIPIKLSDLKYWKIVSKEYGNLTFELAVKAPLLLDMKEHLVSNEYCISYLTVFEYESEHTMFKMESLNCLYKMDKDEVIPKYIRSIRERQGITQSDFANLLNLWLGKKINNKTVNKWENQQLLPTLPQLRAISIAFHVSIDKLLNAYDECYFSTMSIDEKDRTYSVGIGHQFDETFGINDIPGFLDSFKFIHQTFVQDPARPLCYLYFENENNPLSNKDNFIFDAVINDYSVSLVLKENKEIAIKTERIKQLEAYSIHYNYYYEFYGEYLLDNHSVLPFRMIFSLFM